MVIALARYIVFLRTFVAVGTKQICDLGGMGDISTLVRATAVSRTCLRAT